MKKSIIWSILVIALISLPLIVACSSDDDSNGGGKKVDGVNVTTGKKLVELQITYPDYPEVLPVVFKIEYDTKGRLNRILNKEQKYKMENGEAKYYYTGELTEIASIDYDLRVVRISSDSRHTQSYGFVLNEDGYVSQIGTCSLNYDTSGYLIGVEEALGIGTLAYDGNDLIKASASNLSKSNISMYYISYGNVENQGDLYIKIQRSNDRRAYATGLDRPNLTCFIAYQSGLFGKVAKTFINLKSKSEASSLIDYKDDRQSYKGTMTFKCE